MIRIFSPVCNGRTAQPVSYPATHGTPRAPTLQSQQKTHNIQTAFYTVSAHTSEVRARLAACACALQIAAENEARA